MFYKFQIICLTFIIAILYFGIFVLLLRVLLKRKALKSQILSYVILSILGLPFIYFTYSSHLFSAHAVEGTTLIKILISFAASYLLSQLILKRFFKLSILKGSLSFLLNHLLLFFVFYSVQSFLFIALVTSSSMSPSIQVGSVVVINKTAYHLREYISNQVILNHSLPEHGDIVVFQNPLPSLNSSKRANQVSGKTKRPMERSDTPFVVKRILGIPGDWLEFKQGSLYINGSKVTQKIKEELSSTESLFDETVSLSHFPYFIQYPIYKEKFDSWQENQLYVPKKGDYLQFVKSYGKYSKDINTAKDEMTVTLMINNSAYLTFTISSTILDKLNSSEDLIYEHSSLRFYALTLNKGFISWMKDPMENIYEILLSDGFVYVLGDNRVNSFDSRDWGMLPLHYILGKAVTIIPQ